MWPEWYESILLLTTSDILILVCTSGKFQVLILMYLETEGIEVC